MVAEHVKESVFHNFTIPSPAHVHKQSLQQDGNFLTPNYNIIT